MSGIVIAIYILTGFGIIEFRVVETITFGLLPKLLAYKIHIVLWIPLLILLALHILVSSLPKKR